MASKPAQFGQAYASIFQDASVVAAYRHRPPYPPETFAILRGLIPPSAAGLPVLDAGCGTGFVARPLAELVAHVDAVDISPAMVAAGRALPGGGRANLTWQVAALEAAALRPAYALVVAAASLHWMDWDVVLPRLARHLAAGAVLATVEERHRPAPWDPALTPVLARFSMNQDFGPFDVLAELERRGLFRPLGSRETPPAEYRQPVDDWVESVHARNGFSRDRMGPEAARACDDALRAAVGPHATGGVLAQSVAARVTWGEPLAGA